MADLGQMLGEDLRRGKVAEETVKAVADEFARRARETLAAARPCPPSCRPSAVPD